MILVIDNFDSFTYNLVQYLGELTLNSTEIRVVRNDSVSLEDIKFLSPERIVISPGPCSPNEAGISVPTVKRFAGEIPILGICLGHQSIGQAFEGKVVRAKEPVHGKTSLIFHTERGIFAQIPNGFTATRYHSLLIERESLPSCLEVTAWTDSKEIMAITHRQYHNVIGLQFHPESIMTPVGKDLLRNFLNLNKD